MKRSALAFAAVLFAAFSANASNSITPEAPEKLNGCYQISNAEELYGFAAIVNGTHGFTKDKSACGKLTEDIVVNGDFDNIESEDEVVTWNPIDSFAGTFDGNGHTISGLYQNVSRVDDAPDVGFIRVLVANPENPTTIKNLGIVDSWFFAGRFNRGPRLGIFAVDVVDSDPEDDMVSYAKITNCFNQSVAYYMDDGEYSYMVRNIDRNVELTIENSYNARATKLYGGYPDTIEIKNSYVEDSRESNDKDGTKHVTATQFKNGTVAFALHEANSIWGQNVGTDVYPIFSGSVKNSTANRYNVTFHTFTGDTAVYFDSYISGFTYNLPDTVVKENTAFFGWFQNKEFSGEKDTVISDTMSGNLEYWANLRDIYTITFHLNGGYITGLWEGSYDFHSSYSGPDEDVSVYRYLTGVRASLPDGNSDILKDGYFLEGWYEKADFTGDKVDSITATDTGNKDFYAKWFELKTPTLDATDNCYEISDVAELYGFAQMVNRIARSKETEQYPDLCGKLTKDIVINANVLKRDGTLDGSGTKTFLPWLQISYFWGTFDGQGYKISGVYMPGTDGMVSNILARADGKPTIIRNLTIVDSYADGSGLVSYAGNPLTIDNCHFKGYNDMSKSNSLGGLGGLVGHAQTNLVIKNSSYEGKMYSKGFEYIGGLVGSSYENLTLVQNFSRGTAYLESDTSYYSSPSDYWVSVPRAGSLVGNLLGNALVVNNYSVFEMNGQGQGLLGGLVGDYAGVRYMVSRVEVVDVRPLQSYILNNYNMGSFSDEYELGGYSNKWTVENNFYLAMEGVESDGSQPVAASAFEDGTLATALHDYVQKDSEGNVVAGGINGDIWKQGDYYPVFGQKEERNVAVLHKDTTGACSYMFYTPGESVALPEPEREGYDFRGWYRTENFSGGSVTEIASTDSGDLHFYAKWNRIYFLVRVASNDGYAGSVRVGSKWSSSYSTSVFDHYEYGTRVYVEAVPNEGYRFVEWNGVCGTIAYCYFDAMEEVDIVATFERAPSSSSVASSSSEASSSSVAPSSSAEPPKSSSSSAKSSSSVSSSSSAKSSSSSVKSSSSEGKSSSSSGKDALPAFAQVPQFSVSVMNRNLQVAGARVGDRYVLFDMQGNVVLRGTVNSANFNVAVPVPGNYVLRIGYGTRKVAVGY